MKSIIFIITSIILSFSISSQEVIIEGTEKQQHNEISQGSVIVENITIEPEILGPRTVTESTQVTWYASPDITNCGSCQYTWYMSYTASINYSTDIVAGPDGSSDNLYWFVGIEPTDRDFFYMQLKITDTSTNTDYYSNVDYFEVEPL